MPPSPAILQYARKQEKRLVCSRSRPLKTGSVFSAVFGVLFLESAQNALLSVCPSYLSGDLCTSFTFPLSIPP